MAAVRSLPMHVSQAETVTGNSPGYGIDRAKSMVVFLDVTAGSGTLNPTLDIKIQDSADGANWHDIPSAAFTQVTGASSSQRLAISGPIGPYTRAVWTLGGTGPSFTFLLNAYCNEV